MQMCQRVQMAILNHFMILTLDKPQPASRIAHAWAEVESSIYTQCFTFMAKDPSEVYSSLPYHTTAEDPKERSWGGSKEGHITCYMMEPQYYKGCSYPYCSRRHVC